MEIHIDDEATEKFRNLKRRYDMDQSSDSGFLLFMLNHLENCYSAEKCSEELLNSGRHSSSPEVSSTLNRTCPECKYAALCSKDLHEHFESEHPGDGNFSCTCGECYLRLPDFLHHYVYCPVAATDLQENSFEPPHKVSKCFPECRSIKNGTMNTEMFQSYHHPSVQPVPGPSKEKPYGCPKCPKGFKSKSLLDQHMHLHYPPRYKCRWCASVYRWPPAYYHHKQKCKKRPLHGNVEHADANLVKYTPGGAGSTDVSNENLSLAQKALANFMQFSCLALSQLDKNVDPLSPLAPPNGHFPAVQPICKCGEAFSSLAAYSDHSKSCQYMISASHTLDEVSCGILPHASGISGESSLAEDHAASKEPSVRGHFVTAGIFSCSICGKDFNSKLSLKQHVDGKHRAEGKYLCPTCGKRYRWGASFYYHKKTCIASGVDTSMVNQTPELLATNS